MAVSKIRKISSSTLLALLLISIVVIVMFFFGGFELDSKGNKVYEFTGLLLNWTYVLFGLTVLATVCFAGASFLKGLAKNPKKAIMGLGPVLLLVVILLVSYAMADGTPLQGLNADSQGYNTPGWLKMTDMWLYTIYAMFGLTVLAAVCGGVKKLISK